MTWPNTISVGSIRLVPLLSLAVATACGGDVNPTEPSQGATATATAAGLYTLQTSDGEELPYVIPNTTHAVILTYASIRIDNGTYEIEASGSYDGVSRQLWSDFGTIRQTGATLRLTSESYHTTYGASVTSSSVIVVIPGGFQLSTNESFRLRFVNGSERGQHPGAGHTPL